MKYVLILLLSGCASHRHVTECGIDFEICREIAKSLCELQEKDLLSFRTEIKECRKYLYYDCTE